MDKVRVRRIAPGERRMLHRMKRQRVNHVNNAHARVILLSSGGVRNREIAERTGYCPDSVRRIVHRFNQEGLAGIEWFPFTPDPEQVPKFPPGYFDFAASMATCWSVVMTATKPRSLLASLTADH